MNEATLKLLQRVNPRVIIDGGASDGRWSKELWPHFQTAEYILVDPLEYPNKWEGAGVHWVHKCLHAPGIAEVPFCKTDDPFRSGSYDNAAEYKPAVSLVELAGEAKDIFLKLDTHGVEREILKPLGQLFNQISAIQIEVYNFHLTETSPRFGEINAFIESKGYRLATLVDALWRGDGCLWQMDFLYLRKTNPVFKNEGFFYM
jgi:hypothetical protein